MGLLDQVSASETRLSLSLTSGPHWQDQDDDENLPPQPGQGQNYRSTPRVHERNILGTSSSFNGTPSTPGSQGFIFPPSTSVLGRRERVESLTDWSPPTKAHLKEYAEDVAGEYEIPESRREDFVKASQLCTHKLVIVTLAAVLGGQHENMEEKLATYLASSEFKKNVVSKIRAVFLDANLSSYKTGLLNRIMRHIRLNPGAYRIPQEFRNEITGTTFNSAMSSVATGARSEIKRKMTAGWKTKTPIYDLVKSLTWNSSQEMTDRIWGRFAWIQLALVDYTESAAPVDLFWDDIDTKLAEHREKTAEIPLEGRAAYESFKFEEALKLHLSLCKPRAKKKSSQRLTSWQIEVSKAVEEMDGYTQEDLAEEENEPSDESEGGDGDGTSGANLP
ncbi:hypothetical protein B0H10DRAFT_2435952 [Mycena sp. CBHHK59/15]|nr:hypothetical protein B0H10DRAFT_2435952 [Mycena sp. CBHHK59/15]